jgi:hypothetical protein
MSTSTRSFFIEMPAASKEVAHRSNYNTISERNMSTDEAFVCAKDMAMSTSTKPFGTVTFQDGSVAVVRSVPRTPRVVEIIAIFFEAARAQDYAARENSRSAEPAAELTETPTRPAVEPAAAASELSARQSAVLRALRSKMDANKQVEAKAAVLAEAANVPLGSLHSILQSLEKKGLIKNTRAGSARAPAAYQVLQRAARPIDEAEQAA